MNLKHNEGFTLVELIIAMMTGSLVFFAAATLLLLGLRINNQTSYTSRQMYNTNIVLTMLERMATEGSIEGVTYDGDSWIIQKNGQPILSYSSEDQEISIVTGGTSATVLEQVHASHVVMDEKKVLTIAVETNEGTYQSSVYCRTAKLPESEEEQPLVPDEKVPDINKGTEDCRKAFIDVLKTQYRFSGVAPNTGLILNNGVSTGEYYSEWYINTVGGSYGINGWNKDTPWCACYISWALSHPVVEPYVTAPADRIASLDNGTTDAYWFANVDDFKAYFQAKQKEQNKDSRKWIDSADAFDSQGVIRIKTGDIIFFDWTGGNDPAHVGVVIKVDNEEEIVYTIEGNSAGIIALREYSINDNRIIGYGVLPWK